MDSLKSAIIFSFFLKGILPRKELFAAFEHITYFHREMD